MKRWTQCQHQGSGIGYIFGQKGLMYNLTLEGSKFTKLDKMSSRLSRNHSAPMRKDA